MSTYVREKVLRIPLENTSLFPVGVFVDPEDLRDEIEHKFKDIFESSTPTKFQFSPTETCYIDYVLEHEYDACSGEFTRNRSLNYREQLKFKPIFEQLVPDIDMCLVRLVEYCWYNCCEAPDCYDNAGDSFYKEL